MAVRRIRIDEPILSHEVVAAKLFRPGGCSTPDILEDCPDRNCWRFGEATASDWRMRVGDFSVNLTAESLDAQILHVPSEACPEISGLRIRREEGTAQLTIKAVGDTQFRGLGEHPRRSLPKCPIP